MMRQVAARELKNRLGTYLRLVREGVTLLVTDRGRPIAEIRPFAPGASDEEAGLAALAAVGLVTPPAPTKQHAVREPLPRLPGPSLSETIREDRADRL